MIPLSRIAAIKARRSVLPQTEQNATFETIEQAHPTGMSVQQIVAACASLGEKLTEATFRKYVQLGLLPRSVRVGRKGKHQGSQGLYPASTVRQVQLIRRLMAQGFTIEEIQSRFLFVGGDIDALAKEIDRLMTALERVQGAEGTQGTADSLVRREVEEARRLATSLVEKLRDVERRVTLQARMERAAV
jgi:DNA-binding transcriptional MerR regulator